jgi:hypothetical protein
MQCADANSSGPERDLLNRREQSTTQCQMFSYDPIYTPMRGKLSARKLELGTGKSSIVILRRTPGASVVQSPIAALPLSSLVF